MNWIIDRIENNIAVCEYDTAKTIDIPLSALPDGVKEGDVLTLCLSSVQTENRQERINNLMNNLFKD